MTKQEEMQNIKAYPIVEYARQLGYTPVKKGSYYSLAEHDSLMINPETNKYYHNSQYEIGSSSDKDEVGHRGSVIDFAMEFEGLSLPDAIQRVKEISGSYVPPTPRQQQAKKQAEKKELTLPPAAKLENGKRNVKNIYAYLLNTRALDKGVVDYFLTTKHLYQDEKHNCVFVSYDDRGKPNFGCLRGTSTEYRFMGDLPGCDYQSCFLIDNKATTTIVTESVIDLMSVMSDKSEQAGKESLQNYNWQALGGTNKIAALYNHLEKSPQVGMVVLALDADEAGQKATDKAADFIQEHHPEIMLRNWISPNYKDWNEERVQRKRMREAELEDTAPQIAREQRAEPER